VRYYSGGTNLHYYFYGQYFKVPKCKDVPATVMTDSRRRWEVCPGSFYPWGNGTPVRDGWAPDAVRELYLSLELHQDFYAFQLVAQSIPRIRCAVSSNSNLPKVKRIKKNRLKSSRVEKRFCLLAQEGRNSDNLLLALLFGSPLRGGVGRKRMMGKGGGGWKGFPLYLKFRG
jgi:hypothetical protein